MSTKLVLSFVDAVIQHFPPFRWDEEQEKAWVNTMVRELGGFSDDVLEHAMTTMLRTRKVRQIPLVSECIDACVEARRWLEKDRRSGELRDINPSAGESDWSTERVKLAYDLCKSAMGKEAAKDGWVLTLWNFIRKNQRLPKGSEIEACKRTAREFNETYAQCVKGGWPEARHWEKLGASMLAKREALASEVLGR